MFCGILLNSKIHKTFPEIFEKNFGGKKYRAFKAFFGPKCLKMPFFGAKSPMTESTFIKFLSSILKEIHTITIALLDRLSSKSLIW